MKVKILLILVLSVTTLTAFAQDGGVRGRVVSRAGRVALDGVKVTMTPGDVTVMSDERGNFLIENVPAGEYSLQFETPEFEPLSIAVRVGSQVRDINAVVLVPDVPRQMIDDAVFAEFDMETVDDAQALPTSLSASNDIFNNIASYKFSEMRFNVRGYDSQYQDVYMNGIRLNDALTGYTPWSLWSGLNDATRNQEVTSGIVASDVGLGGIGGTTNIITSPSQMRKGLRASLVNGNSMYRFRAMVTYASGYQDNGWSYAFSVSTRQGGNSYVDGVYYNAFGYFAAVEKQFGQRHRLALTLLGAPTERGAQQAATQEAYDLVGNNYYNPNWGWQDGKKRNARVRNNHEPIVMLNYTFDISDRSKLELATALRFGRNGYSALTWQNGPDPRPDYYRYVPSYFALDKNYVGAAWQQVYWQANYQNIRHFDWEQMYQTNYNQNDPLDEQIYGPGRRSNYMVEERHTDQLDWNLAASFSHIFRDNSRINGGLSLRRNRTEYYSQVKDLLGGDYWADVDKFAERDFGSNTEAYQNNLDYYNKYGHAHAAKVGDKYSYDYYAHVLSTRAWASYGFNIGGLGITVGGEVGYAKLWREGLWRKGLFPDNSKGDSRKLDYLTYKAKGNFSYRFSAAHAVEANVVYAGSARVSVLVRFAPYAQHHDAGAFGRARPRRGCVVQPALRRFQGSHFGLLYPHLRPVEGDFLLRRRGGHLYQFRHERHRQGAFRPRGGRLDPDLPHARPERRRELGTIYLRFEPLLPANAGQQRRYRLRRLCLLEGFPGREHTPDGRQRRPVVALEQQHLPLGRLQLLQQHVSLDEPDLPYRRRNHGRYGARRHRTPATPGEVRLGLYAQCQHRQELVYPP